MFAGDENVLHSSIGSAQLVQQIAAEHFRCSIRYSWLCGRLRYSFRFCRGVQPVVQQNVIQIAGCFGGRNAELLLQQLLKLLVELYAFVEQLLFLIDSHECHVNALVESVQCGVSLKEFLRLFSFQRIGLHVLINGVEVAPAVEGALLLHPLGVVLRIFDGEVLEKFVVCGKRAVCAAVQAFEIGGYRCRWI